MVPLDTSWTDYYIEWEVHKGSKDVDGEIAIDDVTFNRDPCPKIG